MVFTALPANAAAPEVTACHGILCCAAAFPVLTHEPARRQIIYSSCHVTAPCAKYTVTSFPHWPHGGPEPLTHWQFVVCSLSSQAFSAMQGFDTWPARCEKLAAKQRDVINIQRWRKVFWTPRAIVTYWRPGPRSPRPVYCTAVTSVDPRAA